MKEQPKLTEQEAMSLLCQALSEDGIDPSSAKVFPFGDGRLVAWVAKAAPFPDIQYRRYYLHRVGSEWMYVSNPDEEEQTG